MIVLPFGLVALVAYRLLKRSKPKLVLIKLDNQKPNLGSNIPNKGNKSSRKNKKRRHVKKV
jgi:hypothetical protein